MRGPTYSFPKSSRGISPAEKPRKPSRMPGPGQYSPRDINLPRTFTIHTKFPAKSSGETPGPSTYTPTRPMSQAHFTFKQDTREIYRFSKSPDKLKTQRSYLPSHCPPAAWSALVVKDTPGPGSYEPRGIQHSVSYSAVNKPVEGRHSYSPGPGSYFTNEAARGQAKSFGREKRPGIRIVAGPGPGTYGTPTRGITRSHSFGKCLRYGKSEVNATPGPGSYNLD